MFALPNFISRGANRSDIMRLEKRCALFRRHAPAAEDFV
jgi:hypothetical protein